MPYPLPEASLFSSISAPRINNELITSNPPTDFINDEQNNLNISKRLDIPTTPSSPISLERRVNSADILRVKQNNNDNKCPLYNRKHPDWLKSLLSRFQQVFLKRTDQKFFSGCEKTSKNASASENDVSIISRPSIDATVRVVNSIVEKEKILKSPKLDDNKNNNNNNDDNDDDSNNCNDDDNSNNSNVDNLSQQEICDSVIPKSLDCNSIRKDSPEKSSIFEVCAKIPRHFAKKPEVLGKVGRFTIVREREDFNTTLFDQCHCQEKPCRFSANGGAHPVLPPETLPDLIPYSSQFYGVDATTNPIGIPIHKGFTSYKPTSQRFDAQLKYNSWESYRQGYSRSPSLYKQSSAATSKSSLSSLKYSTDSTNLNLTNNRTSSSDLTQSRNRSKNIANKPVKPSSSSAVNGLIKHRRSSIKMSDNLPQQQQQQQEPLHDRRLPSFIINVPSKFDTNTVPSKFDTNTVPSKSDVNEPHTTINSHSGRKFEVEWSSSSESASSPSSTMSSVFSVSSSPNSSLYSLQGTSTRSSTLSSKCGRKFEVTVISSGNTG